MKEFGNDEVLPVIEAYACLQGEGKYSGIPHILIRTTGCNLNCQFSDSLCDTAYSSWQPEKGRLTLNDIRKVIEDNPQIDHAFISGGEPTIHPDLVRKLTSLLHGYNYFVAIETNGTHYLENSGLDFITISPKLKNSLPVAGKTIHDVYVNRTVTTQEDAIRHEKNRKAYDPMKKWVDEYSPGDPGGERMYQLKFVVSDGSELEEIRYVQNLLGAPHKNVYLMPEGSTNEYLGKRRQWLMELCIREGYRYTDRLHIIAYGPRRYV
jgi:7-carboxy-7-deazaguanine synthase